MKQYLFLSILFLSLGFYHSTSAQNVPDLIFPDNDAGACPDDCFEFYSACTNERLDLSGETVRWQCGQEYFESPFGPEDSTIDQNGVLCIPYSCVYPDVHQLCMDSPNWEICEVSGCSIMVYQVLPHLGPTFMDINGVQLNSPSFGSTSQSECLEVHQSGELNSFNGAKVLNVCQDPMILTIEGLGMTLESGFCLETKVRFPGDPSASNIRTYDYNDVIAGDQIDITDLLLPLQKDGTTYVLELYITCCNGTQTCNVNTYKFVYIKLFGAKSYDHSAFSYYNVWPPSFYSGYESPPGPVVTPNPDYDPITSPFSPPGIIDFWPFNIVDQTGTGFDWVFGAVDCNDPFAGIFAFQNGTFTEGSPPLNLFVGNLGIETCTCFRLDVSYLDPCSTPNQVLDQYFFRFGEGCPPGIWGGDTKFNDIDMQTDFRLKQNPVQNDLIFQMGSKTDLSSAQLSVYDVSGNVVLNNQISALAGEEIRLDFRAYPSGMYIYQVDLNGEIKTGKFVKQ